MIDHAREKIIFFNLYYESQPIISKGGCQVRLKRTIRENLAVTKKELNTR